MKHKKIGFVCSAFDLLHAGHILMLKDCRSRCDRLIVGLQINPNVDRKWKNKPIQSLEERKIQLEAVKYVDEIILYKTEEDLRNLLGHLMPDVRFLGNDYIGKRFTGDQLEMKYEFLDRSHGYSSSELRKRIWEAENEHRRTEGNS